MADRFPQAQMLKLAEIYRDYPCLWNVNSDHYKDKAVREAAYKKILERLEIPGLTLKDIPKKIKNLRSTYYQELRKIYNSRLSGAVYEPRVSWYKTLEEYLKPFERLHVSSRLFENAFQTYLSNNKDSNSASDNDFETQSEIEDVTIYEEDLKRAEQESSAADEEVNWGITSHTNNSVQTKLNESLPTYLILPSNNQNLTRKIDTMDDDVHSAIAKIEKIADRLTQSTSSLIDKREDEFDSFAKYIATALRALPKELAIIGQTYIQKVLSEIQLRALRQNSDPLLPNSTVKLEDE